MTARKVVVDSIDHHEDEDETPAADPDPWREVPPVGTPDVEEPPL